MVRADSKNQEVNSGSSSVNEPKEEEPKDSKAWADAEPEYSEPSFFTLQVASFKDPARAIKSLHNWRGLGYQAFLYPPDDEGEKFSRVFVGKFEDLAAANALAARLEEGEHVKAFIALLPASKISIP